MINRAAVPISSSRGRVLLIVVLALAMAGAIALMVRSQRDERIAKSEWPRATAVILESKVIETVGETNLEERQMVHVVLSMKYAEDGNIRDAFYVSQFAHRHPSPYKARLVPGTLIPIRYNPRAPEQVSLAPMIPDA